MTIFFKCLSHNFIFTFLPFLSLSVSGCANWVNNFFKFSSSPGGKTWRNNTRDRTKGTERKGERKNEKIPRKEAARFLDRIMRTNANSRSLRCGQAFICHALAAVYSRGQYSTYASRRLSTSCLTSNSSFSSATSARSRHPPLANLLTPSTSFPPPWISERPRRPCTLPQLSATVISHGYFCRIAPPPPHAAVYFSINYADVRE